MLNEFFFGATWDALKISASHIDKVFGYYKDLSDTVKRVMVVNQREVGRDSQRINISTKFGHGLEEDDRTQKVFDFDVGATLLYRKDLDSTNPTGHEVMNYNSVINVVRALTHISEQGNYIPFYTDHTGTNFISGQYRFSGNQSFQGNVTFTNASFVAATTSSKYVLTHGVRTLNALDNAIINLGDIKEYIASRISLFSNNGVYLSKTCNDSSEYEYDFGNLYIMGRQVSTRPFISDPIVFSAEEDVIDDGIWRKIVAHHPEFTLENAVPTDYALYFNDTTTGASFQLTQSHLPHWAYTDANGDLCLGIDTTAINIALPWSPGDAPIDDVGGLSLYLVVREWANAV